jgi:hypothetical protein
MFTAGRQNGSFSLEKTGLIGPHNRENIAAACLAAREQGATMTASSRPSTIARGSPIVWKRWAGSAVCVLSMTPRPPMWMR